MLPTNRNETIDHFSDCLRKSERAVHTINGYLRDLASFSHWLSTTKGEELNPAKISPTDVREYKQYLQINKGMRPSSINRSLASLRCFFQWAEQSGRSKYPIKMPKPQKEQRAAPRWLQRNEQNSLLRAVEKSGNARDIAIVKVLLNTGLRVQELCDLKWNDIAISDRKGNLVVRRGKGEKYREVPLNKDAREAFILAGYSEHNNGSKHVFSGQRGPITDSGVQVALIKYAAMAGLDRISPHCLRHTFCKRLIDSGIGIEKVAILAGHESIETTRRYCEPSKHDLQQAVELISTEE